MRPESREVYTVVEPDDPRGIGRSGERHQMRAVEVGHRSHECSFGNFGTTHAPVGLGVVIEVVDVAGVGREGVVELRQPCRQHRDGGGIGAEMGMQVLNTVGLG